MDTPEEAAAVGRDALRRIVELTLIMVEKAQAQEWTEVLSMESQRQQQIQAFFSAGIPDEDKDWVGRGIREILELDRQMIGLGQRGMNDLFEKINRLQKGRRAQQAYAACSR